MNKQDFILLEDDLVPLYVFMPLNANDDFFSRMMGNMFVAKDTDFYNNVALNSVFLYIYIFHCFLARLYLADDKHIELLKYLQVTEKALSKRDNSNFEFIEKFINKKEINIYLFSGKEKEAINYFFYILSMSSDCVQCKKNQEIFDLRNNIAHFNFYIAKQEDFKKLLENITSNLNFIAEKLYQTTKRLIIKELEDRIKNETIDDVNYIGVFEELNRQYYLSIVDYSIIEKNGYLVNIEEDTPKYYLDKYIKMDLGLGEIGDEITEEFQELIADYFENEVVDHIEPHCYGCQLEEVYIDNVEREENLFVATGTISATVTLGDSDDGQDFKYHSDFKAKISYEYDGEYSFEIQELNLKKREWIDHEPDDEDFV